MSKKKKEAEIIELKAVRESTPLITQNLNKDVFSRMGGNTPLETYSNVAECLTKMGVEVAWYDDYEYKSIDMMSPDDPIYDTAQCRVVPAEERVKEFRERFNNGERLIWAPMAMIFDGKHVLAFGNTRYRALSTCEGENSRAPYAVIDPNNKLEPAVKRLLLATLSSMSNVESRYHAKPDEIEDILKQAKNTWMAITGLRGKDVGKLYAEELGVLAAYDAAKTCEERRKIQKLWFDRWMNRIKPNKYTCKRWRTKLFNEEFGSDKKSNNSLLTEWGDAQRKSKYDAAFPDDIEFNDVRNNPSNLSSKSKQWHLFLSWGTKGKSVTNCVTNLDGKVFREIRDNNARGRFQSISIVMKGETGARESAVRVKNINTVTEGIEKYNNSLIKSGFNESFPIVGKIVFPQQLRDGDKLVDRDYFYKWDENSAKFEEVNKPLVDIEHFKRCSTCDRHKNIRDFNLLSKGKDGRQPRCKECYAKENASSKRNKVATA